MSSLFHYCKSSTFIEKILPNLQLRLSLLKNTNDPKETQEMVFAFTLPYTYSNIINQISSRHCIQVPEIDIYGSPKVLNSRIKHGCKVLCFSTNKSPYFGYEYSRMWALYGENHKGICIQINEKKFVEVNSKYVNNSLFKPIKYFKLNLDKIKHLHYDYLEEKRIGKDKYLNNFKFKNKIPLFFTKYEEWKTEHEKRLIYFSNSEEESEFCNIKSCIEKIHLGLDFNMVYLPVIQKLLNDDSKIFKIEFKDVRLSSVPIRDLGY